MDGLVLEWYLDSDRKVELFGLRAKFVCAEKDGCFKLVLETTKRRARNHSEIARMLWDEGFKVRGGGVLAVYSFGVEIMWDSKTMEVDFGWDRPRDEQKAAKLLWSLKEALEKMSS